MRQPAVADRFYPGSPEALALTLAELLPASPPSGRQKALAVISPHAGYMYSGALAATTFASVAIPETVILLGPNHRGLGVPIALSTTTWNMPLGSVPVDQEMCTLVLKHSQLVKVDELAHKHEHSLEVQIPFLQVLQKKLRIVPLTISHISYKDCQALAETLSMAIHESSRDVLIVASSDMNHYESRKTTDKKDGLALQCIQRMNPFDLYNTVIENRITMCGVIPAVIAILAAKAQGGKESRLVGHTDSGYVSGDIGQVVGYAGVVINS
ncbi:MAG: AmmeMemoRadiSam system protein B [Desulforhopalus sp.]|nr:AmmeMemoRadiSam system protein B [Desulforhopalus sp.]